jgi:hypothetical protein
MKVNAARLASGGTVLRVGHSGLWSELLAAPALVVVVRPRHVPACRC